MIPSSPAAYPQTLFTHPINFSGINFHIQMLNAFSAWKYGHAVYFRQHEHEGMDASDVFLHACFLESENFSFTEASKCLSCSFLAYEDNLSDARVGSQAAWNKTPAEV